MIEITLTHNHMLILPFLCSCCSITTEISTYYQYYHHASPSPPKHHHQRIINATPSKLCSQTTDLYPKNNACIALVLRSLHWISVHNKCITFKILVQVVYHTLQKLAPSYLCTQHPKCLQFFTKPSCTNLRLST